MKRKYISYFLIAIVGVIIYLEPVPKGYSTLHGCSVLDIFITINCEYSPMRKFFLAISFLWALIETWLDKNN